MTKCALAQPHPRSKHRYIPYRKGERTTRKKRKNGCSPRPSILETLLHSRTHGRRSSSKSRFQTNTSVCSSPSFLFFTHTSHIYSCSFQIHSLTYFFFSLFRDSWLARQQRKSSRRTWVCYGFWISFMIIVAAVVIVIIWLLNNGYFASGGSSSNGSDAGN